MKPIGMAAGLLAALWLLPDVAPGQCMGGTGGAHEHGTAVAADGTAAEKRTRQSIGRLLAEERSRELLLDALLGDPPFMREIIRRIAADPEWKALAVERLVTQPAMPAPARPDSAAVGTPASRDGAEPALYRCPMHRDITSTRPGSCSKCGMALRRQR